MTRQCGLIGDPVAHSLSPVMQNAAFRHLELDVSYELWPTTAQDVPARVASLRNDGVLGASVTVPHKQLVMPECDDISATAQRIGAVNTIVRESGRLLGDNTDAYGFLASVQAAGVSEAQLETALVLGAGGAARAVLVGLQGLGVPRILLANRNLPKASHLADELGAGDVVPLAWSSIDGELPSVSLVVNATSLGWHDGESPLSTSQLARVPAGAVIFDLTYRETDLLRSASARGLATIDGLEMLVRQGARSFSIWTGEEAPIDVMRQAVLAEQARRATQRA